MEDETRAATPEEKRWFKRLKKCLAEMPKTVEIQVHHNILQMNVEGSREATFSDPNGKGDADNVPELDFFRTRRVYPCSESV